MGNEVATRPNLSAMMKGLKNAASQAPAAGGTQYLRFAKGDWTYGRERVDVTGDVVIFNPMELRTGYICWTDYSKKEMADRKKKGLPAKNELVDEVMAPSHTGVDPETLEDHSPWEWQVQQEITGAFRSNGTSFKYATLSYGGLKAMRQMTEAVMERLAQGVEEFVYPVVTLDVGGYDNETYGTYVHEPVFEIIGWADIEGRMEDESETPQLRKEEPPVEEEEHDENPPSETAEVPDEETEGGLEEPPVRRRRVRQ